MIKYFKIAFQLGDPIHFKSNEVGLDRIKFTFIYSFSLSMCLKSNFFFFLLVIILKLKRINDQVIVLQIEILM